MAKHGRYSRIRELWGEACPKCKEVFLQGTHHICLSKCKYCLALHRNPSTQMCNRCWNLDVGIRKDPEIARLIMVDMRFRIGKVPRG